MNNYWEGKRVLVTGGTGFIGTWLVKELLEKGAKVSCLVSSIPSPNSNFCKLNLKEKVNLLLRDLSDIKPELIKEDLHKESIQIIFHLAGQAILSKAMQDPFRTLQVNILGPATLLEAYRTIGKDKIESIVLCSSINAYGDNGGKILKEEDPLKGELPYEVSMSCLDMVAQSYAKTFDLPVGIARFSNVYGPGDLSFKRLIPTTIKSVIMNEPIELRNEGQTQRGFLYVSDAVNALLNLAEKVGKEKMVGEAFNFGPDKNHKIKDVVEEIIRLSNKPYQKLNLISQSNDKERKNQFIDVTKAGEKLGWASRIDLNQGLQETFKWYLDYFSEEVRK